MKAQPLTGLNLLTFEINSVTYHALPISEFSGYYATTRGYIISTRKGDAQILAAFETNGYLRVSFWSQGRRTHKRVHRLVAAAFFATPDADRYETERTQVNHIDGNRQNNAVTNLEWCSQKENYEHWDKLLRVVDKQVATNV
jgi:hypothetical protein|tara:strand:+ start:603 stop:1028 length:426 start_codon:yes stop_codon:yes gene_type:complete